MKKLGLVLLILGPVLAGVWLLHNEQVKAELQAQEAEVIAELQNYRGRDDRGPTVLEVMDRNIINGPYEDEDIINHPDTRIAWSALRCDGQLWEVRFLFKTYREESDLRFYIHMDTGKVEAKNQSGRQFLDILDWY